MIIADIPSGANVFIDANVLIYHFAPHPTLQPCCQQPLMRVSTGEIGGFTSSAVLSNVAHRLMTYEAADKYGWSMTGLAYHLQRHPEELKALTRFGQAVEEVPGFGVQVHAVDASHVFVAARLSQQHGLLSGDALVAALMQAHGMTNLASGDTDFDRVPWINRFAPG
jgi:predicted nucleic acid-binding protein